MLPPYQYIWDWDLILGCAVKAISSQGVRSPCLHLMKRMNMNVPSEIISPHIASLVVTKVTFGNEFLWD